MRRIALATGLLVLGAAIATAGLHAQSKPVDLDATMKRVGPANAALRKSIEAMDAKVAKEQGEILERAFDDVEKFFESRGKHDAHQWASDAKKVVDTIERAVGDSKWDDVKASANSLGKICATCHTAYREKAEDGTFRMKPGN
jgi:cytochrome c556